VIKRPVLVENNKIIGLGFAEANYEAALQKWVL
jgi:arsenate reductase-like glutaredoxin family protein